MQVLSENQLKTMKDREVVNGVVYISSYNIGLTKKNEEFISGEIMSGVSVPFKVWKNAVAFSKLRNEEFQSRVVFISGVCNVYQGTTQLVIDTVTAVDESVFSVEMFLPVKYNKDAYWNGLKSQFEYKVSDKAKAIANAALFDNAEVAERFKTEFAAKSHHDNCVSGLMAHTYKVMRLMDTILAEYKPLTQNINDSTVNQDMFDICKLGVLFHDIGKVKEMKLGVYQPASMVTHRYLGIEMLPKDMIIEAYGEEGWLQLVAILLQHHGEFGDDCRTLGAYLVHKCDLLEAQLTSICTSLSNPIASSAGDRIKQDDLWLTI